MVMSDRKRGRGGRGYNASVTVIHCFDKEIMWKGFPYYLFVKTAPLATRAIAIQGLSTPPLLCPSLTTFKF